MAPRSVRLASDYACGFPLWDGAGRLSTGDLELSPELEQDLVAWQELFDAHFHWGRGWDDSSHEQAYATAADGLADRMRWELGDGADVTVDLWPVDATRDDVHASRTFDRHPPDGD